MIKNIYFHCIPAGPPEKAAYQHDIVRLGEGLKELGIPIYSNVDYWNQNTLDTPDFLFKYDKDIDYNSCDAVVISHRVMDYSKLPKYYFNKKRKYKLIYLDHSDGIITPCFRDDFREFDLIYKAHYSDKVRYPSNCKPDTFGLSNRIISALLKLPEPVKNKSILVNYRVSHGLRLLADKEIVLKLSPFINIEKTTQGFSTTPENPKDKLEWMQTGRRHYPEYFRLLKNNYAVACFGGYFSHFKGEYSFLGDAFFKSWARIKPNGKILNQWDSWRLWETLVAGSAMIHVDFDKYGCNFPCSPTNWEEYVGFDLDNLKNDLERLISEIDKLPIIGEAGKKWALKNYSPLAIASRFLGDLNSF